MVALLCLSWLHIYDDITLKMSSFPDRLHPGVKRNAENIVSMKIFTIFLEKYPNCTLIRWNMCWQVRPGIVKTGELKSIEID